MDQPLDRRVMRHALVLVLLAVAAASYGAETPVSAPVFAEGYGFQTAASVVSNGETFYAAWLDGRSGTTLPRVYGTLLNSRAELLAVLGVPLDERTRGEVISAVRVVWTGRAYAVFWLSTAGIFGRRIDLDGSLLETSPIRITSDASDSPDSLSVSANGETIIVSFHETLTIVDRDLRLVTIAPTASLGLTNAAVVTDGFDYLLVAPPGIATRVNSRANPLSAPVRLDRLGAMAWTGSVYVTAYSEPDGGVGVQRLDRDGRAVGNPSFIATSVAQDVRIASRGDGTAVVLWHAPLPNGVLRIFVARVTSTTIEAPNEIGATSAPATLAASVSQYLVATGGEGIDFVRVGPDASRIDTAPAQPGGEDTRSASVQRRFTADRLAQSALILWEEEIGHQPTRIMGRVIGAAGQQVGNPFVVVPSGQPQYAPAIATNGSSNRLVWYEGGPGQIKILTTRVTSDGRAVDSPTVLGDPLFNPDNPVVDNRLAPPTVIWDGLGFLVAFTARASRQIEVARFSVEGSLLQVPRPVAQLSRAENTQTNPVFTRFHNATVLVWAEGQIAEVCVGGCPVASEGSIRAVRLLPGGIPIDTSPLPVSETNRGFHPDAASDGTTALFTWTENGAVRGRRFDSSGATLDPRPFVIGPAVGTTRSSVFFYRTQFIVAWDTGGPAFEPFGEAQPLDIYGARVPPAGEAREFAILSVKKLDQLAPVVWVMPNDTVAVTFQRFTVSAETQDIARLVYTTDWPPIEVVRRRRAIAR